MKFNDHSDLAEAHAFLSPSKYHWLGYTPEKLEDVYAHHRAKIEGTELHEFASVAIKKKIKLANNKKCLNMFVNDAIGFKMASEQILFYSYNCFGTADAILFKDGLLRVHDLKTGFSKPSFKQLRIYNALFCLEYDINPYEIRFENRLYQFNGFTVDEPSPEEVAYVMDRIVESDRLLENIKQNR